MSDIKLSFCIPTYNRADFIGQTLTSIADQIIEGGWTDCIEICVSDNASKDNTDEVLSEFQTNYPSVRLVYSKNSENLGADRNYLRVVDLALGDYCWFLGSDDVVKPGAVDRILQETKHDYDIYLGNRTECNKELHPESNRFWLKSSVDDAVFNLSNQKELLEYLNNAISLGALFSYLSSIVFRREKWHMVHYDDNFTGTAYSHVFMLMSIINYGCKLKYIKDSIVLCRGGNDSFSQNSQAKRIILDLDGYTKLAEVFFKQDKVVYDSFLKVLSAECVVTYFANVINVMRIKAYSEKKDWDHMVMRYKEIGNGNLNLMIIDILPLVIARFAAKIKKSQFKI